MKKHCRHFSLPLKAALTLCLLATTPAHAGSYFNMRESFSSDITPFPKWTGMISRFDGQREVPDEECGTRRFHPCSIKDWKALAESSRNKPLKQQLNRANDYGNAYPYIIDQLNWGMEDYWDTPYEFFEMSGDCEDYAISKYYTLRAMGLPASRMRIIIVQDFNLGGVIHAVLGVYGGDKLYILDNQIKQVVEASSIYHYKPIYGINEEGWWAYYPRS